MKIKEFAKKHKKKLLIAGGIIGGIALINWVHEDKTVSINKLGSHEFVVSDNLPTKVLEPTSKLLEMGISQVDDWDGALEIRSDTGYVMSLKDLGKLGEAMCELDGVNENSKVWTLVNAEKA